MHCLMPLEEGHLVPTTYLLSYSLTHRNEEVKVFRGNPWLFSNTPEMEASREAPGKIPLE